MSTDPTLTPKSFLSFKPKIEVIYSLSDESKECPQIKILVSSQRAKFLELLILSITGDPSSRKR